MGSRRGIRQNRRFQVPGSLRVPPLKDLAIAKSLALSLLWLPARLGCESLLGGLREETSSNPYQLCLQSLVRVCLLLTLFCLYWVQSHHCSPGPMLSSPAMSPACLSLPQSQGPSEHQARSHAPSFGGESASPPTTQKAMQDLLHPPAPTPSAQATGGPLAQFLNTSV